VAVILDICVTSKAYIERSSTAYAASLPSGKLPSDARKSMCRLEFLISKVLLMLRMAPTNGVRSLSTTLPVPAWLCKRFVGGGLALGQRIFCRWAGLAVALFDSAAIVGRPPHLTFVTRFRASKLANYGPAERLAGGAVGLGFADFVTAPRGGGGVLTGLGPID
jgi:hypothetical protein